MSMVEFQQQYDVSKHYAAGSQVSDRCPLGYLFSKSDFSKKSFRNNIRVSNSLDPDQARLFVEPDLVPDYLQKLSADDNRRQRVKKS